MNWKIPLADLDYGEAEEQAVLQVLRSKWLTMGAVTQEFEAAFADFTNTPHAIAVSNATVALHLACLVLGIGPGDEVILPSLTFVATANAVLYTGANVVFADIIGVDDLTLDPESVRACITPRTRMIIPMHYAGFPCHMQELLCLADQYGLNLVEDAAHAPGAFLHNKALGAWGDVGCFSFFSNKNLSTGEGGMLLTHREDLAERLRLLRSHGMTSLTWDRHLGHAYSYDVVALGYNYRLDEMRSALGLIQLHKLVTNNARRREITMRYWQGLKGLGLGLPFCPPASLIHDARDDALPAYHIFPVLLPEETKRTDFIDLLREQGIQTSIHYPPVHQFSYYRSLYPNIVLPRTEAVAARQVTLPLYPGMHNAQVDTVIQSVRHALAELS